MPTRRWILAGSAWVPFFIFCPIGRADTATNLLISNNRIFVKATVNGHAVTALLDSAAESSLIDTRFAQSIGLIGARQVEARGSGGDTEAQMAEGVRMDVLGQALGPLEVAVLDLSDVGRRLLHGPLQVVLGRELFDAARWDIDLGRQRMQTVPRAAAPAGTLLKLTTERGIETFPASVEGHPAVQTVFDLGNGGDALIGAQYAKAIGILADGRPVSHKKGGGLGGERDRKALVLRSIEIAGRRFTDVSAVVDETGSAADLNVGVPILRQFHIVSDYAQHRLWLGS